MVIRLHNVTKWSRLAPGEALDLRGTQRRKIRVELNCPAPTRLDVLEGDKLTFLAVVQGYEVVEFAASADAALVPTSDDEVWYFTNDGDRDALEKSPFAVSFTKIASRRARNPELERMMFKMEQNMQRRMAKLQAEMDDMRAAQPPHDPETGEVDETGGGAGAGYVDPASAAGAAGGDPEPAGEGADGDAKPGA